LWVNLPEFISAVRVVSELYFEGITETVWAA